MKKPGLYLIVWGVTTKRREPRPAAGAMLRVLGLRRGMFATREHPVLDNPGRHAP